MGVHRRGDCGFYSVWGLSRVRVLRADQESLLEDSTRGHVVIVEWFLENPYTKILKSRDKLTRLGLSTRFSCVF